MLSQNQGGPVKMGRGLKAVVHHCFSLHTDCDSSWCGAMENPSYQHRNLPYGRDLQSDDLKKALLKIFVEGLKNQTEKLAFLGSSQANESFNNILATKAPKYKHYSESSSLHYRLCSAVCQKNMGYTYVATVRTCHIWFLVPLFWHILHNPSMKSHIFGTYPILINTLCRIILHYTE